MGRRGKVVFARIADEKKRKESLRKRKAGLLKKVRELTILCGLEATVIVRNREDNEPTVWPSKEEAKTTIKKFLNRSIVERKSRSHNTKSLFTLKCKRLKNKVKRLKERNDRRILQAQITSIYDGKTKIEDLDAEQRKKLSDFADKRKEELQKHVKRIKRKEQQAVNRAHTGSSVLQIPREAASGRNRDGLSVGRNSAPACCQLMNDRCMTQLAPSLSLRLQDPYQLYVPRFKATENRRRMTGKMASGININALAGGGIVSSFTAMTQGQLMNDQGMTQLAPTALSLSLPTPDLIVISHDTSVGNGLDMTERFYGQTNIGGMMQQNLSSSSFMRPTAPFANPIQAPYLDQAPHMVPQWPSVYQPSSGLNINDLTGGGIISSPAATTQDQLMNVQGNRLNMTERFYRHTNIGHMMQHPRHSPSFRPPHEPFSISDVQSMASGLNSMNDGFINTSGLNSANDDFINVSTRTLTSDGHFNERIQRASPPRLPLELPRRLGLPPVQHDASGRNMLSNESRIGSTESGTTMLDQSSFGAEYWNAIEFPEPAIQRVNQSNIGNGMNNGMWDDLDVALSHFIGG